MLERVPFDAVSSQGWGARGNLQLCRCFNAQGNLTLRSPTKAQNVKRNHIKKRHYSRKGIESEIQYGLVDEPITSKEVMKIPEAKAVVDKEWNKIQNLRQAKNDGRDVHFASFMNLCHLKHDNGHKAVFSAQSASATQVAAAILMDIMSRLPGMAREVSDARSVHTQVHLSEAPSC